MSGTQPFGQRRVTGTEYDDGLSRRFVPDPTDPRQVIAETLARRGGWGEIRPTHWAAAGALTRALKAAQCLRTKPEQRTARVKAEAAGRPGEAGDG